MEFETVMVMTLEELDKLLLNAGLEYQAKWSREREEYKLGDTNICLDKNAGYGYMAEFEKVVEDRALADVVKKELLDCSKPCHLSAVKISGEYKRFRQFH